MKTALSSKDLKPLRKTLRRANLGHLERFPGESMARQPVHTVYGGAHLFNPNLASKMGPSALQTLSDHAPDAASLARVLGFTDAKLAGTVYARVVEKLKREPVEDFRIDFEDGYGNRPDAEEDGHAIEAATKVAEGLAAGTLPPFLGIRIKPLNEELVERSLRTLDLFIATLLEKNGGKWPTQFFITLPKVTVPEQVTMLVRVLDLIEKTHKLKKGSIQMELMIETTQSIVRTDGSFAPRVLYEACEGRCFGAHFGTYDYTASCNITAAFQAMDHQACDFARHVMQVSLAGTGVMLSDGATNVMPVGPHRAAEGKPLTAEQKAENQAVVHRAWQLSAKHIRHSLENAYFQGWDLHPAQLPIRYATIYAFFLEGLESASKRLKAFMEKAAQATLVGDVFDDAATGQGLLNFFLRGLACGALTEGEVHATGLTTEELRTRSFLKILDGRKAPKAVAAAAPAAAPEKKSKEK
jgi:citrate lyase beta subunit